MMVRDNGNGWWGCRKRQDKERYSRGGGGRTGGLTGGAAWGRQCGQTGLVTVSKKWKTSYGINIKTEVAHRNETEAQRVLGRSLAKDKQVEARAKEHEPETNNAALYK
jgi:hypothetical protein